MDFDILFYRSGQRLKAIIPRVFKWNVVIVILGVIVGFLVAVANDFVTGIFVLLFGALSAAIEIGAMYFFFLNLFSHAEQSDNSFEILNALTRKAAPADPPVYAAPVVKQPKEMPQAAAPEKETKPEPVVQKPVQRAPQRKAPPKPGSFAEELSYALRYTTDDGMRNYLIRLIENEKYADHRAALADILEEVPRNAQRRAVEQLLEKLS